MVSEQQTLPGLRKGQCRLEAEGSKLDMPPHCGAVHVSRDETAAINLRRYPFLSQEEKVLLARKDVGKAEQAADPLRAVSQETVSKTELRSEPEADASQTSAFEGSREGCFNRAKGKTESAPEGVSYSGW